MSNFYKRHIFFCNNIRTDGKQCCSQGGAKVMYRYAKDKCRDNASLGEGRLGVSESRCLGRCENGPVVVVYPDNVWYQYIDCLLYTSPSPRDAHESRMPSSA